MTGDAATTVFVVDDDHAFRDSLRWLLESAVHRVAVFSTAESFLAAYDPQQSGCLVLDIRMPGMSGLDLQRQLVAANSPIPIVFITSHGDYDARARALEAGAVDFLYKPFREEALLKAIDSALNHK